MDRQIGRQTDRKIGREIGQMDGWKDSIDRRGWDRIGQIRQIHHSKYRKIEIEKDGSIDRQIDRQTDRQNDRQIDRQIDGQTDRELLALRRQIVLQLDTWTGRQIDSQIDQTHQVGQIGETDQIDTGRPHETRLDQIRLD